GSRSGSPFLSPPCELAEAVGFEPTNGCPLPVFKTGAFNHSATLPLIPPEPRPAAALFLHAAACRSVVRCLLGRGAGLSDDFAAAQPCALHHRRDLLGQEIDEHAHRRQQPPAGGEHGVEGALRQPPLWQYHLELATAHG